MESHKTVRPTKKQHELLNFIEAFIAENGYSPSYREIMNGCNYTSVATVALHVNSLISRGHIRKRDRSARSLEVVKREAHATVEEGDAAEISDVVAGTDVVGWLAEDIKRRLAAYTSEDETALHDIQTLIAALLILGGKALAAKAEGFSKRLDAVADRHLSEAA